MNAPVEPQRRRRLSVDLPADTEMAVRTLADRYFRGVASDAIRAALSFLTWTAGERDRGRRIIAVSGEDLPSRYAEPVLPELTGPGDDWTWLVRRPHAWRRQPYIKGTRLVAGDLARTIEVEGWTVDRAAGEYDLPRDAILEAQGYLVGHRDLVFAEERENAIAAQAAAAAAAG